VKTPSLTSPSVNNPAQSATLAEDTLAAALTALGARFHGQSVMLGEVLDTLGARASALLIVLCALPFSTPVSIPGLSTPFGLVILLLATRYFFGLPPWLPQRLRRVRLPGDFFAKIIGASSKLVGWLELRLRPRWHALADREWKLRLHTGAVIFAALLLMLPLPPLPPFTNTLPALVAVVLTFSILKRDGLGILAGHAILLFTVGYFIFWWEVLVTVFQKVTERLFG
jgi:hypothetical protein